MEEVIATGFNPWINGEHLIVPRKKWFCSLQFCKKL